MDSPMRLDEVIAKRLPFVPKLLNQSLHRLLLSIPLNAIENGIGEKF